MSEEKNSYIKKAGEIKITRFFDASRDLVWKNWTEPEHIKTWWGPKGFTCSFVNIDLHVGGVALYCMRSSEGLDYWSTGIYREIVKPSRIVCTDSFADERGNIVPASYYGLSSDQPLKMVWIVTFEVINDKTKFTLKHSGLLAGSMCDLTYQGWNESLDKFEDSLKYSLPRDSKDLRQQIKNS
jgi:uncharacterized protein YndB with AHSA1/START domain